MIICLDTETTGLSPVTDEILSISIIDGYGNVLFDSLVKPISHTDWKSAEIINRITPDMVKDAPTMNDILPTIQKIIYASDLIIEYNIAFDLSFLKEAGIKISERIKKKDVMQYSNGYRMRLSSAADNFGYDWGNDKVHGSLADAKATLYVYYQSKVFALKKKAHKEIRDMKYPNPSAWNDEDKEYREWKRDLVVKMLPKNLWVNFLCDMSAMRKTITKENEFIELAKWLQIRFRKYRNERLQYRLALSNEILDIIEKSEDSSR